MTFFLIDHSKFCHSKTGQNCNISTAQTQNVTRNFGYPLNPTPNTHTHTHTQRASRIIWLVPYHTNLCSLYWLVLLKAFHKIPKYKFFKLIHLALIVSIKLQSSLPSGSSILQIESCHLILKMSALKGFLFFGKKDGKYFGQIILLVCRKKVRSSG